MKRIFILDTTLRDGEQSPGMAITPEAKAKIATLLDNLGVDIIEVGFPAASKIDYEAVIQCSYAVKESMLCVFSRLYDKDIEVAINSIENMPKKMIHLSVPATDYAIRKSLKTDKNGLIKIILDYIKYLKKSSFKIEIGLRDIFKADLDFVIDFFKTIDKKVDVINIADTDGSATLDTISFLISSIKNSISSIKDNSTRLSIHCHNDNGLSLIKAIKAVELGARQIECCILGVGERAGNTSLEELCIHLSQNKDYKTNIDYRKLEETTKEISSILCVPLKQFSPIFGINVNFHSSGIHQKEITEGEKYISSEILFSSNHNFILSRHSGKTGILSKIIDLIKIEPEKEVLEIVIKKIKNSKNRIVNITELLEILKSYNLYTKEIKKVENISIDKKDSGYYVSIKYKNKTNYAFSENIYNAIFFCLEETFKSKTKVSYYTIGSCGNNDTNESYAYVECKSENKIFKAIAYSKDLFTALINAYTDIINETIAKSQ